MIIHSDNLGAFGLTELDKVKSAYKKKNGVGIQATGDEYKSVKSGYLAYMGNGGKPMASPDKKELARIAIALKNYVAVLPWKTLQLLEGMYLASIIHPKIADKVVNPEKAKQRKKLVKIEYQKSKPEKSNVIQSLVETAQHPIVDTTRNVAITVGIVATVILIYKFKKD